MVRAMSTLKLRPVSPFENMPDVWFFLSICRAPRPAIWRGRILAADRRMSYVYSLFSS